MVKSTRVVYKTNITRKETGKIEAEGNIKWNDLIVN